MPWESIYMNAKTFTYVQDAAKERGYHHVRARLVPVQDLLHEEMYLFTSGAPHHIIKELIRQAQMEGDALS